MSAIILILMYAVLQIVHNNGFIHHKHIEKILYMFTLLIIINNIYVWLNGDYHTTKTIRITNVNNIVSKDFDIELTTGRTVAVEITSTPSRLGKFIGVSYNTTYKLYINPEDVNKDDS